MIHKLLLVCVLQVRRLQARGHITVSAVVGVPRYLLSAKFELIAQRAPWHTIAHPVPLLRMYSTPMALDLRYNEMSMLLTELSESDRH